MLPQRGYKVRIWCARYPDKKQLANYKDRLAPFITKQLDKLGPEWVGKSTMPSRFTDGDLAKRERSIGRSTFALQYMLDTQGSDKDKYPLKMRDLLVASLDPRRGPEAIVWSNSEEQRRRDLPNLGFDGDWLHDGIIPPGTPMLPYSKIIAVADPSGQGADETAFVIIGELNGFLFVLRMWATREGYALPTLRTIAQLCVEYRVHEIIAEDNFGDGMFSALLSPVLAAEWKRVENAKPPILKPGDPVGTSVVNVKSTNQMAKEKRILAVLEPAIQQHRVVVHSGVFEWDERSLKDIDGEENRARYSLGHQFSRLTRIKDSLVHDDRIEALALAAGQFAELLGVDPVLVAKETSLERQLEEFNEKYGPLDGLDDRGLPMRAGRDDRPESFNRRTMR